MKVVCVGLCGRVGKSASECKSLVAYACFSLFTSRYSWVDEFLAQGSGSAGQKMPNDCGWRWMWIQQNYLINIYANTIARRPSKCHGRSVYASIFLCARSNLNPAKTQVPSIKGKLTLKEATALDVANLSSIIQDTYLLWNSTTPIDTHTAFNSAEWTHNMSPLTPLTADGIHVAHDS